MSGIVNENDTAYLMFDKMIESSIAPVICRHFCLFLCRVLDKSPVWIYNFMVEYNYASADVMDIVLGSDIG